ncbi:MAG: LysM peptidoglycan-binding domain-containing protein [Caldilineaceae bacterium]|nr:LysM peptidoglycan-binding domain-containing protein [Caldilineaceae bacterium]
MRFHWMLRLLLVCVLAVSSLGVLMTPQNALAASSRQETQAVYYTVQRGDTLSAIARRFDTTVDVLMRLNNLSSTRIYAGQSLLVRSAAETAYVVTRGDTLSSIAQRYGVTVAAIQAANNLRTTVIFVGQQLRIPVGGADPDGRERIQFAPGGISATVRGYATAIAPKRYVLRAAAGQTMTLNLSAQSVFAGITLIDPNGRHLIGGEYRSQQWTGLLPLSGDYIVEVLNGGQGGVDFSLTVTVR